MKFTVPKPGRQASANTRSFADSSSDVSISSDEAPTEATQNTPHQDMHEEEIELVRHEEDGVVLYLHDISYMRYGGEGSENHGEEDKEIEAQPEQTDQPELRPVPEPTPTPRPRQRRVRFNLPDDDDFIPFELTSSEQSFFTRQRDNSAAGPSTSAPETNTETSPEAAADSTAPAGASATEGAGNSNYRPIPAPRHFPPSQ